MVNGEIDEVWLAKLMGYPPEPAPTPVAAPAPTPVAAPAPAPVAAEPLPADPGGYYMDQGDGAPVWVSTADTGSTDQTATMNTGGRSLWGRVTNAADPRNIFQNAAQLPGSPEAVLSAIDATGHGDASWNPYDPNGASIWDIGAGGTALSQDPNMRDIGRTVGTVVGGAFAGPALAGGYTAAGVPAGALSNAAAAATLGAGTTAAGGGNRNEILQSGLKGAIAGGLATGAYDYFKSTPGLAELNGMTMGEQVAFLEANGVSPADISSITGGAEGFEAQDLADMSGIKTNPIIPEPPVAEPTTPVEITGKFLPPDPSITPILPPSQVGPTIEASRFPSDPEQTPPFVQLPPTPEFTPPVQITGQRNPLPPDPEQTPPPILQLPPTPEFTPPVQITGQRNPLPPDPEQTPPPILQLPPTPEFTPPVQITGSKLPPDPEQAPIIPLPPIPDVPGVTPQAFTPPPQTVEVTGQRDQSPILQLPHDLPHGAIGSGDIVPDPPPIDPAPITDATPTPNPVQTPPPDYRWMRNALKGLTQMATPGLIGAASISGPKKDKREEEFSRMINPNYVPPQLGS